MTEKKESEVLKRDHLFDYWEQIVINQSNLPSVTELTGSFRPRIPLAAL